MLALAAFAAALPARAQTAEKLLLEIWVDGRNSHAVVPVTLDGTKILLAPADLASAGVNVDSEATSDIDVTATAGLKAEIDVPNQRLILTAPPSLLSKQVFDVQPPANDNGASSASTGATLTYDLSAETDDAARLGRSLQGGAALALDIFTLDAFLTTNGFINVGAGAIPGARLDTAVEFDDETNLTRLIVGDAVAGALDWSRAVRFAGVEYARDFSLRPGLVTIPLPDFFGEAAVPTSVEVFSGSAQVFQQDVAPGPFELRNLPVVTGQGTATVVTKDVLGRETTHSLSLYTTANLLAPGLTSFAFDAGVMRRYYGERSFAYDQPIVVGTVRYGATQTITVEAHGEAAPGLGMAGMGAATGIGDVGAVSADVAASTSRLGTGYLATANLEAGGDTISFYGSATATSGAFRDLASLDGTPLPRLRYQLGLSGSLGDAGSASINWIGSKPYQGDAHSFVAASYFNSWRNGAVLAVSGLHDVGSHNWSVQVTFSLPVGAGTAATSALNDNGRMSGQAAYDAPVNPDGGFGWRLEGDAGDLNRVQGEAALLDEHVRADGGVAWNNGRVAVRAGLSGALVAMGGSAFVTRDPGGAVALVNAGQPGVRVLRENRVIAISNADGQALITGLDPNADNHLAVDARDYPIDVVLGDPERTVVPRRHAGIAIDFAPVSFTPTTVVIETGTHATPPAGTPVQVVGAATSMVMGHGGQLFVVDAKAAQTVAMNIAGNRCVARVEAASEADNQRVWCIREASDAD